MYMYWYGDDGRDFRLEMDLTGAGDWRSNPHGVLLVRYGSGEHDRHAVHRHPVPGHHLSRGQPAALVARQRAAGLLEQVQQHLAGAAVCVSRPRHAAVGIWWTRCNILAYNNRIFRVMFPSPTKPRAPPTVIELRLSSIHLTRSLSVSQAQLISSSFDLTPFTSFSSLVLVDLSGFPLLVPCPDWSGLSLLVDLFVVGSSLTTSCRVNTCGSRARGLPFLPAATRCDSESSHLLQHVSELRF